MGMKNTIQLRRTEQNHSHPKLETYVVGIELAVVVTLGHDTNNTRSTGKSLLYNIDGAREK